MAKLIEFRLPIQPTGKLKVDPATAAMIGQGKTKRQETAAGANAYAASKRASLDRLNREIGESNGRLVAHQAEFQSTCGGRVHVPPVPAWVVALLYAVGIVAELAIADALLDYSFLRGRPADALTFLEHFEGRGFIEGLLFVVTDYSTPKELVAAGIAIFVFVAAKVTGTWTRQREAKRQSVSTWLVVATNAVFFSACVAFVVLRHASMAANPDSADLAYLAPVFLPIQLFFYAVATYVAAWLADPDTEARRLNALVNRERKILERLMRQRAEVSAEVTSVLITAQAKCDQIANQTMWDISAYRHGNLKYRDRETPVPEFLLAPVGPEVFEPVAFEPPPDCPAHTLEEVLGKTGTG
jgi:hypothetical protein